MDIRHYPEKQNIKGGGGERGVALLMTMMFIVLLLGFSLLMFQNASVEGMIAGYVKQEKAALALAESGIEQTLAWFAEPSGAPNSDFFSKTVCNKNDAFSKEVELPGIENKVKVHIDWAKKRTDRSCTVSVSTANGKGIKVEVGRNPMPPITAAVQGRKNDPGPNKALDDRNVVVSNKAPGIIRWANASPPLDPVDMKKLKSFIRQYGRYFTAFDNCLVETGHTECKSFHNTFSRGSIKKAEERGYDLVFITGKERDLSSKEPLSSIAAQASSIDVLPDFYKGYFYFTEDVIVQGVGSGRFFNVTTNEPVSNMHLDGLFYTSKKITFHGTFNLYGAIYADLGFDWGGDCTLATNSPPSPCLKVWYNSAFLNADYKDVVPMIRIPGTWRTM